LTYGLILAVGMTFFSYFFSEEIPLISAQAQPVSQTQHQETYARFSPVVGDLSRRMNWGT
jgi:hypothetical protein